MASLRGLIRAGAATVFLVATVAVSALAATPAAGASRITWSLVSAPGNTPLSGVACVAESDCWAVGGTFFSGGTVQSVAQHWNGSAWSFVTTPNTSPSEANDLIGVGCVSSSDCWAVGTADSGSGSSEETLAEHWNGSAWSIVTTPNTSSPTNLLDGVACVSTSDCWAVGISNIGSVATQTLAEHWNGSTWSIVTTPNTSSPTNDLQGVACISSSDCWAVGLSSSGLPEQTLALQWNGSAWSIVATPNTSPSQTNALSGLACLSASDCWAVGFAGSGRNNLPLTLAEHWNGSAWSIVTTPNPGNPPLGPVYLTGVACTSSSDCWAVGYSPGLAEHWNGSTWSIVTTPNTPETKSLAGVACTSALDCWAVGTGTSQTLIEHWSVRTRITRPGAPTGIVATPGIGSISVSWTAPASNGGSPILYYVVSATYNGTKTCTAPGPTATGPTACTVMGLRGGHDYTVRVRAVNAIGESPTATVTVFLPRA